MKTRTNIVISAAVGVAILGLIALRGGDVPAPPLGAERIPDNEARVMAKFIHDLERHIVAADGTKPTLRGAHPKHHGCARADFTVVDNLRPELRVGLFQAGAKYPAWVRFSNNTEAQSDLEPSLRTMAIKLLNVDGDKLFQSDPTDTTHDLLLVSYPIFSFADVATYVKAFAAFIANKAPQFFLYPTELQLDSFAISRKMRAQHADLLDIRWWSMVPYRFGNGKAVKYSVRPCSGSGTKLPLEASDSYLKARLSERLSNGTGCFEFMLQAQTDAATMPIEDPTVEWDEQLSPFEPVALLTIEPQRFTSTAQMKFCEDLSFNPWRSLPEHQPLGGINRARGEIFKAIAAIRRARDKPLAAEPRELSFFE